MNRSKHLKDTYTPMSKRLYLEGVKGRLVNDVGTYFTAIDVEGSKGNMVGLIQNNLHPIMEELRRWKSIIGIRYYASQQRIVPKESVHTT